MVYRNSQPAIAESSSDLGELLILILFGVLSMAIILGGLAISDPTLSIIFITLGLIIAGLTIALMVVQLISDVMKLRINLMNLRELRRQKQNRE